MRQKMRDARRMAHLTANEAAGLIGVHVNALLRWERGEADPKGSNLIALSKLYGVSPEALLELSDRCATVAK